MIIELNILAIPKQSVRQGLTRTGTTIFYQDTKYSKYKKEIILQTRAQLAVGFSPFLGPLEVSVMYIFPPLKSFKKKDLEYIENGGHIIKLTKPDVTDNLNKALFDSLEGLLYDNDSRIAKFSSLKVYGTKAKIILNINPIENIYI